MRIDLKNCTLKIKDGGSNELEVKIGEGNFTFSEKTTREYYLNRGRLDAVRDGDEVPVEVKMDFTYEFLKADTSDPPTVRDALYNEGEASDWVSSDDDTCQPYAVDLEFTFDPPCTGEKSEIVLLPLFRHESLDFDPKAATVSVSGKCNVTKATLTRILQST